MIDINYKSEEIFENIKTYISAKSKYSPTIKKSVVDNVYPLVVFETNLNESDSISQDYYRLDQTRKLSFEINIFAVDKNGINSNIICDELANLVCSVMQGYYLMQGGIDVKLKNINTSKATKYVLHFTYLWNLRENKIIY